MRRFALILILYSFVVPAHAGIRHTVELCKRFVYEYGTGWPERAGLSEQEVDDFEKKAWLLDWDTESKLGLAVKKVANHKYSDDDFLTKAADLDLLLHIISKQSLWQWEFKRLAAPRAVLFVGPSGKAVAIDSRGHIYKGAVGLDLYQQKTWLPDFRNFQLYR